MMSNNAVAVPLMLLSSMGDTNKFVNVSLGFFKQLFYQSADWLFNLIKILHCDVINTWVCCGFALQ